MTSTSVRRSGGRLIVDALLANGVDTAFLVPGESYLTVLDGLFEARDRIRTITCRQEGGAANMAEAYGKLTGRPGVLMVTRGPGACNASIGLHTAFQDSTPMVVLIGQVQRDALDREAFQEVDYRRMFGQMAKWVGQVDEAALVPEMISRAFHMAVAGRPGPVVLALPEDMQQDETDAQPVGPYHVVRAHPGAAQMQEMAALLAKAERPVMMVGGGGWTARAAADITDFAQSWGLPVCSSFRCQDIIDNYDDCWIGDLGTGVNPALVKRVKESDLLLVVGPRLGEITTQSYSLLGLPRPEQTLIHVHADPEELGSVFYPDLPINAGMAEFAAAAKALAPEGGAAWAEWARAARADYLETLKPGVCAGELDMNEVMRVLAARLPKDAIVSNDAGNFALWPQRYHRFSRFKSQLAPTSGAMGYAVPAAIAACVAEPERQSVGWAGDGGFMMSGQEIATAIHYGLKPLLIVVNNSMYGTIRMHQEKRFADRVSGTELTNPDFAALARAYGAHGETVTRTDEFAPALERALAADKCALIELQIDPQTISTRATLDQLKGAGR